MESELPSPSSIARARPLCRIPTSSFLMGSDAGADDERPAHRVSVDAFLLAACQVTNVEYALFLQATNHAPPPSWGVAAFDDPAQPVVAVRRPDTPPQRAMPLPLTAP